MQWEGDVFAHGSEEGETAACGLGEGIFLNLTVPSKNIQVDM